MIMPFGTHRGRAISGIPSGYVYRGYDKNPYLPEFSGHYWMNGYAIWRPKRLSGMTGKRGNVIFGRIE